jgi:DNA-binding transcriptional ArsR family regulator
LETGEKTVTELANKTKLKQANVSQHLPIMRSIRLIKERREGNRVFYSLANMKIAKACNLMRTMMTEQLLEEVKATSSG